MITFADRLKEILKVQTVEVTFRKDPETPRRPELPNGETEQKQFFKITFIGVRKWSFASDNELYRLWHRSVFKPNRGRVK